MTMDRSALYSEQELEEMLTPEELAEYRVLNPDGNYYIGLSYDLATYLNKNAPPYITYRMCPIGWASEYVYRKLYGTWKVVSAEEALGLGVALMLYRKKLIAEILSGKDITSTLEGQEALDWKARYNENSLFRH